MIRTAPVWLGFLILLGSLHGQAMVEAGLAVSQTAGTAAAAKGVGTALGGLMGGKEKLLQTMQQQVGKAEGTSAVTLVPPEKMATPKDDGRTYEDPKLIQPGLAYDELVQRFGPPAMEMTTAPGRKSLMYAGKDGATTSIEVQDGKVAAPEAPKPKAKPAATPQYVVMTVK